MIRCLNFLLRAFLTMMAVPSSGEPTDSCVCSLAGVHEPCDSSHVSVLKQVCLCALGQGSECASSQAFSAFVQACLLQTHCAACCLLCTLRPYRRLAATQLPP